MSTIPMISEAENAINQVLRFWRHQFRSWGMSWSYEDSDGKRWEVAYDRDRDEVQVYLPNQGRMGPHRVIGFEPWRTDVDKVATPATVAKHLADLPGW